MIKQGDTLYLGKGSLPNKDFVLFYDNPRSIAVSSSPSRYLPASFTGRYVVVKELSINGSKRSGFGAFALVNVGHPIRYRVELDNAIEAGEIIPPPSLRQVFPATVTLPVVSVADEILKLKQLLDAGAITQEEYDG